MAQHVYTVRLPNRELTDLFINYVNAVDWKYIMDSEDIVLFHMDYSALTVSD